MLGFKNGTNNDNGTPDRIVSLNSSVAFPGFKDNGYYHITSEGKIIEKCPHLYDSEKWPEHDIDISKK